MNQKLPPLEDLAIGEIPNYIGGYKSCHVEYPVGRRKKSRVASFEIKPEDAVFLRKLYDRNGLFVPPTDHISFAKIITLSAIGLVDKKMI